jgi:very-short-patch-repair endonuclease/predicted transcriptional regulator of viral defense system
MREPVHQTHVPRGFGEPERRGPREADGEITELARSQHGVITRAQLLTVGVSARQVELRVESGLLVRLHRGVYAVGHTALRVEGRRLAAVLACGPHAVLSHRDAGADWGLCSDAGVRFHVTVPRGGARGGRRAGIHVHTARLLPAEITTHDGIPITTSAATLVDLATVLDDKGLTEAVDRAIELRLFDGDAIDAALRPGRPGAAALRRTLAARHPRSHETRSRLERAMLRLLDAHGVPPPRVNDGVPELDGVIPDLLWPDERLVVELDGYAFHRSRAAFEGDRRKTADLQAAGYAVLRFTWRQIHEDPEWVVDRLRTARAAAGPRAARPRPAGARPARPRPARRPA